MSTTSPINGFQMPTLSDTSDIEVAVQTPVLAIDSRVTSRFATTSARDTAITVPVAGMLSYVSGTEEMYLYNGSAWVSAIPRFKYKLSTQLVSSTSYVDVSNLTFSVESSSRYLLQYKIYGNSYVNPGWIYYAFNFPSGAFIDWSYTFREYGTDYLRAIQWAGYATPDLDAAHLKYDISNIWESTYDLVLTTSTTPGTFAMRTNVNGGGGNSSIYGYSWAKSTKIA